MVLPNRAYKNYALSWGGYAIQAVPQTIAALQQEVKHLNSIIESYKQREQTIWKNWELFHQIVDFAPVLIYILQNDRLRYVNSTFSRITGYTREECLNMNAWDFIHPDCREMTRIRNQSCLEGENTTPYATIILTQSGCSYWGYLSSGLINLDGDPAAIGIIQSISELKQFEDVLLASEAKFAKVFTASPELIVISTLDGLYLDVNERFTTITGYDRADVIGKTSDELNIWVNAEERALMKRLILIDGFIRNLEVKIRTKDGTERIGLLSAEAIEINSQACVINILNDITEHKHLSHQIARLDRLNLVGEIAASIGHEMRNPMTSVRGFLQMFMGEASLLPYHEYFALMIEELDRANQIISEFLSLAKNKTISLQPDNLKRIVQALAPLLAADTIKQDKHLCLILQNVPDILLDEKEIRQLIFNLVRNALEAMEHGKTVTIYTYTDEEDVILEVSDQGCGIEWDIIDKIDAPFFTTKEQGTGLGLPVCHSIAARHSATIEVKTSNRGTSFVVRFSTHDDYGFNNLVLRGL